ncbi:MAG: hypothetical protein AB1445_02005 [Bacillota bacterium]
MSPEVIDGLLNEESILERVKVQDLLAVASGARPASVVTVPAELPEAAQLGREIDRQFYAHMEGRDHDPYDPIARLVGRAVDRVRKKVLTEIKYKTEALNNIVVENLKDAAGYRALKKFVEELGLRVEVEISRPTIQEMYLMTSADLALDVRELGRLRRDLRHMALRNPVPHGPVHRRLFPEESSLEFTRAAGRLLGYPACCIERYGFDQASVTLPAEERASGQITRGRAAGEEPDPFAYFTRDFFPCDPRCPEASAMGHRVHHALKELSNRAAEFYRRQLHENVELVVRYPEIIQEHIARLQEHARAAGGGKVGPAG